MQRGHPVIELQVEHEHLIVVPGEAKIDELLLHRLERGVQLRRRGVLARRQRLPHLHDVVHGVVHLRHLVTDPGEQIELLLQIGGAGLRP